MWRLHDIFCGEIRECFLLRGCMIFLVEVLRFVVVERLRDFVCGGVV